MEKVKSISIIFPLYKDKSTVKKMIFKSSQLIKKLKKKGEVVIVDDGCPEKSGNYAKKISQNYNIKELEIDENDSYILNHNWHGNVRELRNLIERIAILQPDTKEKISNIVKESLKNEKSIEKENQAPNN